MNLDLSHHNKPHLPSRSNRYEYFGTVHLQLVDGPVRHSLALSGKNLSASGLAAYLPLASAGQRELADLAAFLQQGEKYLLQIEHAFPLVEFPIIQSRLVRLTRELGGAVLGFAFLSGNLELLGLLQEFALNKSQI